MNTYFCQGQHLAGLIKFFLVKRWFDYEVHMVYFVLLFLTRYERRLTGRITPNSFIIHQLVTLVGPIEQTHTFCQLFFSWERQIWRLFRAGVPEGQSMRPLGLLYSQFQLNHKSQLKDSVFHRIIFHFSPNHGSWVRKKTRH